ncbi:NAD(P)/FAD-dependent oxidoreductase [Halorussus marinus]|uniref:NAD(P)/FAD-dependent oxidoreductase n=1 Tax=Halorussus marinus TaxID=2505976 RepID=UPI0010924412|nr:FAD-dependent oxidoreductase [Halorussus marinus]
MPTVAIVGAGVAGLGAAYRLRETDAEVIVFERRESVGGRAATRRRNGCTVDVGANYCKDGDDRVARLLREELSDGLVEADGPVWTFDADGEISEGRGDDGSKWTYREGLAALGDRLRAASDAAVRTGTEVTGLARDGDRWRVETRDVGGSVDGDGDGATVRADAVVLTPPGPTTADLLADSELGDDGLRSTLVEAASAVPYRTILSVALGYGDRIEAPYYALVNADKGHDLGWVAREECKPGHVPDGESVLVVQPAPEWSRRRYDDTDDELAAAAAERAADLLDDTARERFDWAEVVRWREALPDAGADREALDRGADAGLFFAGDWVVGEGRLHAALASGLDAGDRVDADR